MAQLFFKRYRMHFDLRRSLPGLPVIPPNYEAIPWREQLAERHAHAKFESFRSEMDASVFPCLGQLDGCLRLMREIAQRPNFLPAATWLMTYHSQTSRGAIDCGTIQGLVDADRIGAIQNLGVAPAHRGIGLATYLLTHALHGFQSEGLKTASLEVTAQNLTAYQLYLRYGFLPIKTVYKTVGYEAVN